LVCFIPQDMVKTTGSEMQVFVLNPGTTDLEETMKGISTCLLGAILLAFAGWPPTASAATEAEKLAAIQSGLMHLCVTQSNGTWMSPYDGPDAFTGAAVFAFLSQQGKWPNPAQCIQGSSTVSFQTVVANGINALLNDAILVTNLQNNSAGTNICPGGTGTCSGIYWYANEQTYSTGFVASAIDVYGISQGVNNVATTTGPLKGLTWLQIAQDITNEFASYQSTLVGSYAGGWHYSPAQSDADMSTHQWGVISIGYDELVGASTPSFVRSLMKNNWLVWDQTSNGGACYSGPNSSPCTHSDTGGWLTSMAFVGNANNTAAGLGIGWLNTHWTDAPNGWSGIFVPSGSGCSTTTGAMWGCAPYAYSMWAAYKGLESNIGLADNTHVTNLKTDCGRAIGHLPSASSPSGGVCNWWEDQNEYLVRTQNSNGSWTDNYGEWPDPLNTALFVNILGAVPLPASITQGSQTTVPTLSFWGLVALAIVLVGFAATRLRKASLRHS
jgi:hypothetical protein